MSGTPRVILYTRPLCLLCHRVADLLRQACVHFKQVDVTNRSEQDRISASCNAPSFPIVLVDGRYIGGYAHILQLHATGRLTQLGGAAVTERTDAAAVVPAASAISAAPSARSQVSGSYSFQARSRTSSMAILHEALKKDPPKETP